MSRKKNDDFLSSAAKNTYAFQHYMARLTKLALSRFKWSGLPETVDERFLELTLFSEGAAIFFRDDVLGYLALQQASNGGFDVYRNPIERNAYASNGYYQHLDISNSVIVYENYLRSPIESDIVFFASKLANVDSAIDVNANAQKTPILIVCDQEQRLTMQNLYMKYQGNMPFIFGDKKLNPNDIQVLTTGAPYVADKLYSLKEQYWGEALNYLGIITQNEQKKERLLTDEVNFDQAATISSRDSSLEARRQACDKINQMFPELHITCEFRDSIIGESSITNGLNRESGG